MRNLFFPFALILLVTPAWGQGALPGGGDVVTDTTPQLGGDLDLNGNDITDATAAEIRIGGVLVGLFNAAGLALGGGDATDQLLLPTGCDSTPSLAWGDGAPGFCANGSAGPIQFWSENAARFSFQATGIFGITAGAFQLLNETSTATNPTLAPNRNDPASGVGGISGNVSIINSSVETARFSSTGLDLFVGDATDSLILPLQNDAVTPTLGFGDGDTGLFEAADDALVFANTGIARLQFTAGAFYNVQNATGPAMMLENSSATNPVWTTAGNASTGIGGISGEVSVITGGVEAINVNASQKITATSTLSAATGNESAFQLNYTVNKATSGDDTGLKIAMTDTASPGTSRPIDVLIGGTSRFRVTDNGTVQSDGDLDLLNGGWILNAGVIQNRNTNGFSLADSNCSPTVPTLRPDKADGNTGWGCTAGDTDVLVGITGGVERTRIASTGEVSFSFGTVPAKKTADPCGSGFPEGSIFYNDTSNYMCYCDGTNDVQVHSPATACF